MVKDSLRMQVLTLVAGSAAFIRSAHGWRTVCALITVTCLHPDAAPTALNALSVVACSPALSAVAFTPVLEAIVSGVERCAKVCCTDMLICERQSRRWANVGQLIACHGQRSQCC